MYDPERIPVIIGVGQINDRPNDPMAGLTSRELMAAALRAAEADTGAAVLADLDSLAVVDQISFSDENPIPGWLAAEIGAKPAILEQTPMASGDSPILLLNQAANRIGAGQIRLAAVVGGEALRTAAGRAASADGSGSTQNRMQQLAKAHAKGLRARYGLKAPVDIYPLYENAGRAAHGQTLAEAQAESAEIWALFSQVAEGNEGAWMRRAVAAEAIATVNADNRPIAFPYSKLMVANAAVNQGAGFIVASLAEARRRGVADAVIIHIGNGAAAHEAEDPLARDNFVRSPAMVVSLKRALDLNAITAQEIDLVELYSCFPCVPKMARRVIDWPLDRPATVFGGLTFGGGPIGNYMSHAVVSMVRRLREGAGQRGLLFANGGYATHNHTILLGREQFAAAQFPRDFDFQQEADAARGPIPPMIEDYAGPATIETYTVLYNHDGTPATGVIVAQTPGGGRTLASVPASDAATIAFLTEGKSEAVASEGVIVKQADGRQVFECELQMAPTRGHSA